MLSVLGQRNLPSRVIRLLLLKVVGSNPAHFASPEGDRPCAVARRSMDRQISECLSMGRVSYKAFRFASGKYYYSTIDIGPYSGTSSGGCRGGLHLRRRYVPRLEEEKSATPFASAEEAWFWFVRCQRIRREGGTFRHASTASLERPCDPDDIYRATIRLVSEKILHRQHLTVLGTFGLLGRPPDPRQDDEDSAARLWQEALESLAGVLRSKHIIV